MDFLYQRTINPSFDENTCRESLGAITSLIEEIFQKVEQKFRPLV